MRRRLIARLRYLRNWEALNAALIPIAVVFLIWTHDPVTPGWFVRVYGLALFSGLLVVDALYWHAKLLATEQRRNEASARLERRIRRIRPAIWVLMLAFPLSSAALIGIGMASASDAAWGGTFFVLTIARALAGDAGSMDWKRRRRRAHTAS